MSDHAERLVRARAVLRARGLDAFLAGPSADLFWLAGYRAPALERLTMLVVPAEGDATLIVPELEAPRAAASPAPDVAELVTWAESGDPVGEVRSSLARAGVPGDAVLAVQDRLCSMFLLQLQDALPAARWRTGRDVSRDLRLRKTPAEVELLRAAAAAIDRVHARVPQFLRPGRTEAQVGRDIAEAILEEHDQVNFVIVASGPNGASPHHETADRVLQDGDAIVVDIGGTRAGYCSDMTRDYVLGRVPDGYAELHAVLEEAQRAGVDAIRAGVAAENIDRTCRSIIAAGGYGELFTHRTGHGIGVEEHEDPYLVAGNDEPLEPGMAFSVEPGIYVPGRYGARIEDIVVVTESGAERLNRLDRGIVEVGG
ncbi:MAG: Xaa-Pro peptidase family protein [Actinomycetota bacterium]|nr:Xaa-Pro peptidase family protein [Actinomycetota bacterium]